MRVQRKQELVIDRVAVNHHLARLPRQFFVKSGRFTSEQADHFVQSLDLFLVPRYCASQQTPRISLGKLAPQSTAAGRIAHIVRAMSIWNVIHGLDERLGSIGQ